MIEAANFLEFFCESCPDEVPELRRYAAEGRLEAVPLRSILYTQLPSGETLIRNCLRGRQIVLDKLGVCGSIATLSDIPGVTPQLPQIAAKCGFAGVFLSHGTPPHIDCVEYEAPDGTVIPAYAPIHYGRTRRLFADAEDYETMCANEAPADLLDYWKNEYAKLNKEVPPEFKLMKSGATAAHLRYKLTCRNFGDTPTYASITIPKGKGPFPMIFTVPPAGNYGYGFFSTPKTIHVTITVFDRLFPTNDDYMKFNRPVWYFHQGAQKRETYYYYKAILGMMRVMDYAMTQIKEWDGKHLMAIGRSQGGGSAIIMAALNPKIQALAADVPALCDHNARLNGRRPGWPQILDQKTTAKSFATDAEYFDAANFASFVKCPAVLSVGFYDTMCEPSSVYSAYNNLKGPKKMIHCPRYGHGWGKRDTAFDNEVIKIRSETFMK